MDRLKKAIKTVLHLGLRQTGLFAFYQIGLRTGHYARVLNQNPKLTEGIEFKKLLPTPGKVESRSLLGDAGLAQLLDEADHIVDENKYRQFGGPLMPIVLIPPVQEPMQDWTVYESGKSKVDAADIKFVWEPARFGWAVSLARAYLLTSEPKYAKKFWALFDEFNSRNPYLKGPNWQSGQEVAIRLTTILLCAPVFLENDAQRQAHEAQLVAFIVEHAMRIPPTLIYARAQHNNHLITEALALLCAGYSLPDHPNTEQWRKLGFRWLKNAFLKQTTDSGEYVQYSNNYHRVMLQSAMVATAVLRKNGISWPKNVQSKLVTATHWMAAEVDPISGKVANYGHNDGAYLFPFANGDFADYRPVVQASKLMFFEESAFESGSWDEMAMWLGLDTANNRLPSKVMDRKLETKNGVWASMRGRAYQSRPGHADQNHVDIWWQGEPIALDAGTYRYNAEEPWDNQLMGTKVHNTITVDGKDQMDRAGRFLWLDWSVGKVTKEGNKKLVGVHDGYSRIGMLHRRIVESKEQSQWVVDDELIPLFSRDHTPHELQLHWLLADWDWVLNGSELTLYKEHRKVVLSITCDVEVDASIQVCRGGEVIVGEGECILQMGWYSPIYSIKKPALSLVYRIKSSAPVRIISDWKFLEQ